MSHYCIFSKKPSTSAKKCFIFQYFQWLFGLFALSHHPHSNCPHRIEPAKNECNGTQILICTVCNLHKGHVFFLSSSTFRHIFVQLSVHFARLFDSFHVSPICHFLCFFFVINSILSVLSVCNSNLASTSKRGRKHQTNRPTKEDTIRKLCEMYLVQLIEFNVKLEDGKHSEHTEIRQSDFRINCVFLSSLSWSCTTGVHPVCTTKWLCKFVCVRQRYLL